ncbi:hypothetical protein C8R47DRAFT_1090983 [Mycena vitilis]|nr:hypothetical protein C8R47DRAFT_1090983 [Mycena vitilis]
MFALRRLFALAFVSVAAAATLSARANTNAAINTAVDQVDVNLRHVGPAILTLQANHTLSAATLGPQFTSMEHAFTNLTNSLKATGVSSGSNTTSPTNDEIGVTFSDALQLVATSLSGPSTQAVPGFATMVATFDPILSNAAAQYNVTLPGGLALVHIMMLDASQFLRTEGFTQTLTTLGF